MQRYDPRPFEVLDSVERLKCIANEPRLAILGRLVARARTGGQIARELDSRAPLVHYHLTKLVEHGFVVEVPVADEEKGRRSERYFRATARHLFLDPGLAGRDDAATRRLVASFEQALAAWQRTELLDLDLGAIASRVIGDGLELGAGDEVLLISQPQVREIVEHLFLEAELRGARPRMRPWSREYALARLDRSSDEQLATLPFSPFDELDELAAVVLVSSTQPTGPPPNEAQREKLPFLLRAHGEWTREVRARGVRFVELSIPARGDYDPELGEPDRAESWFWEALTTPPATLEAHARTLASTVEGAADATTGAAQLTLLDASGGRLTVDVEARAPVLGLGRLSAADAGAGRLYDEFPAGSVTWIPAPDSGSGALTLPYVVVGPDRARDVRLTLERGRITGVEGDDAELVRGALERAAGDADAVAEVRVGVNPIGGELTGKASLDGVQAGTVTLAFGTNELQGGDRRATLDLRFPSRGIELRVGDRTLVEPGGSRRHPPTSEPPARPEPRPGGGATRETRQAGHGSRSASSRGRNPP